MRFVTSILLFLQVSLFAVQTDFDVAVVGTSPICMLEAIFHLGRNERVLLLEADEKCGGAWKSIDICGISHADLGCHKLGSNPRIKEFFEKYFGCKFVCLDHPGCEPDSSHERCPNGYYFSGGCHELITRLKSRLDSYSNACFVNQKLESIFIDSENGLIELSFGHERYTTSKLKITSMSHFKVANPLFTNQDFSSYLYYHLYVLLEDEAPASFTYLTGIASGMNRAMNLTPFLQMPRENLQLIVFQAQSKNHLNEVQSFCEALKRKGLLTANAKILESDTYTFQQSCMNIRALQMLAGSLVEVLDTSNFAAMYKYLEKWQSTMTPLVAP